MTIQIIIPKSIKSNYTGYRDLLNLASIYNICTQDTSVVLNFKENTWFDANLLPALYAIVELGRQKGVTSIYRNQHDCTLTKLFVRNGFGKHCFNLEYCPHDSETVIPFKVFKANDTYNFSHYMDDELIGYFPSMDLAVKKAISSYIQELFGNAQIHGNCAYVYTCGQYYPYYHKMDFTIVNLGRTFQENVIPYLTEMDAVLPDNSISWAVQPNHSTKRGTTGGIGLSLMKDFISYNKGKFQIISGREFWEINNGAEGKREFEQVFPGTIVNIEIDQNDTNLYIHDVPSNSELLF